MYAKLFKWQMQLDQLSLRERGLIAVVIFISISFLWSVLIHDNEVARIEKLQREKARELKQITVFNQQKRRILDEATSQKNFTLRNKHAKLRRKMTELDGKMRTYQQRTVSKQQLAVMLQEVLQNTQGLKIISFSTEKKINENKAVPLNKTAPLNKVIKLAAEHIQPKYYLLTLEGNYFSIQTYLNRLEQLSWKLYWDKLDYKVKQFPLAQVLIQFHTLSIEND